MAPFKDVQGYWVAATLEARDNKNQTQKRASKKRYDTKASRVREFFNSKAKGKPFRPTSFSRVTVCCWDTACHGQGLVF